MITFFAVCSFAFIQCNFIKDSIDEGIYAAIHSILKNQYPDEPEKSQCMIDDFRRNHVADKFYTPDLITNTEKLKREIQVCVDKNLLDSMTNSHFQPYVDEANLKCTLIAFFQSPLGICVLVALFLLAISIICCLIRCICC